MESPAVPQPAPLPLPEKPSDNLFYWSLFGLATLAVIISLGTSLAAVFLLPRPVATSVLPPKLVPTTTLTPTPSPTRATLSPSPSPSRAVSPSPTQPLAQSETWVLKGYAVGKQAGNDTGNPMMADVIRLSDGRYRMYYGWAGPNQKTAIKSAISTDAKTWTVESGYRLEGVSTTSDRENVISGPSLVRLPDGRWRMYYQSSPQVEQGTAPGFHVRSAISTDGLTFTREGIRIDISPHDSSTGLTLAGHGTYFIASDGTYVGIFSGNLNTPNTTPSSLIMAESTDGLTWKNFKALYQTWHDPIVIKTTDGYRIYATYLTEKQGTAFSSDGLSWPASMTDITMQDSQGGKLTEANSGVGDIGGVVLADGSIRLFVNYGNPADSIAYLDKK